MNKENKHYVDCGCWYIDENGKTHYEGEDTNNGICYKDYRAWKENKGVIYISEYTLIDFSRGDIPESDLWTRESWMQYVKEELKRCYSDETCFQEMISDDEFISLIAYDAFDMADWQDLSTAFDSFDCNGDWILTNWDLYKENN